MTLSPPVPCFRPWSALGPPHHAVRGNPRAALTSRVPRPWDAVSSSYPASSGPASRRRDLGGEDRPALPETSSSLGGDGFLAEAEVGPIPPHAMQNGGQLAGQGHLGALHAATLGHRQRQ